MMLYETRLKIECSDEVSVRVRGNIPFFPHEGATLAIESSAERQYFVFDITHCMWVTTSGKTGDGFIDARSKSPLSSEDIAKIFQMAKWEIMPQ